MLNFSYAKWYPLFKHISLKSEIFELPDDFVDYLLEDGIFVHEKAFPTPEKEDRF